MSTRPETLLTPEQYLEIERHAETKSEYFHGRMYAMSGGTGNHAFLATNILIALGAALRGTNCRAVNSDLRVLTSQSGLYTYPDAMILCGAPHYVDSHADVLTNPTVIFEVLSPSTAAYDRGAKFHSYRQIESLKEYVLVAQDAYTVERFERQPGNRWLLSIHSGMDGTLDLSSVSCSLPLASIYTGVDIGSVD